MRWAGLGTTVSRPNTRLRKCSLTARKPPRPPTGGAFPVRRQDKAGAGVSHLYAIAAGFVDLEEEGLLDGMLVQARLDVGAVSRKMSAARKMSSRLSSA